MEDARMLSQEDIKQVQDLIELCIQQDMTRGETVARISERQKQFSAIFVELVWMRLEEENREFFEAYHLRLILKRQILHFNNLLKRQAELMNQGQSSEPSCLPVTNGSNVKPTEDTGHVKRECFQPIMPACFPSSCVDGVMHPGESILSVVPSGRRDPFEPRAASCDMRGFVKSESGYSYTPQVMFDADGNVLERRADIGDASSVACFYDMPNSQPLNEQFFNVDMSSALLEQPPRNLPFLEFSDFPSFVADSDDFLNSPGEQHKLGESWSY
ncbi:hypothetical protein Dimus_013855 [Dionaea muscipula]